MSLVSLAVQTVTNPKISMVLYSGFVALQVAVDSQSSALDTLAREIPMAVLFGGLLIYVMRQLNERDKTQAENQRLAESQRIEEQKSRDEQWERIMKERDVLWQSVLEGTRTTTKESLSRALDTLDKQDERWRQFIAARDERYRVMFTELQNAMTRVASSS